MPRVSPALIRQATAIDRRLVPLLPVCRDLASARNELRWLKEHASRQKDASSCLKRSLNRRAEGEPLQYILGSEFFGNLEIECRPGVLIPRQDTAASTTFLVQRLRVRPDISSIQVVDLCTGSGCIPLLFHDVFHRRQNTQDLRLIGIDVSPTAVALARANLTRQIAEQTTQFPWQEQRLRSLRAMDFFEADICEVDIPTLCQNDSAQHSEQYRILISNPPYISNHEYRTTTSRSVRRFEPVRALVPGLSPSDAEANDGDTFYPRLLDIAGRMRAHVMLFEVSDMDQAGRVATWIIQRGEWSGVEIWADDPAARAECRSINILGRTVKVVGIGNGRSVLAYREQAVVGV